MKTRVARVVGDAAAAELASALLGDSYERFSGLPGAPLWVMGDEPQAAPFADLLGEEISYRAQGNGSLGARLRRAFADPPESASGAIAIGADAPHLDPAVLVEAAEVVRSGRVALGPALDGGYYLIGVPCGAVDLEALFPETGWGEPGVLAHARAVLGESLPSAHGWQEFSPLADLDEWADVVELFRLLVPSETSSESRGPSSRDPESRDPELRQPVRSAVDPRLRGRSTPGAGSPQAENPLESAPRLHVLPRTGPRVAELCVRYGAARERDE